MKERHLMSAEYDDLLQQFAQFRKGSIEILTEMDLELSAIKLALAIGKPVSESKLSSFREMVQNQRPQLQAKNAQLLPPFRKPDE